MLHCTRRSLLSWTGCNLYHSPRQWKYYNRLLLTKCLVCVLTSYSKNWNKYLVREDTNQTCGSENFILQKLNYIHNNPSQETGSNELAIW